MKSHAKKEYGETFGQNVQKSGADKGQEAKAAFTKAENKFSGQDNSGQTEENGKRQEEKEDYHRRDTYRQSQEKGKYHKSVCSESINTGKKPKIPFYGRCRKGLYGGSCFGVYRKREIKKETETGAESHREGQKARGKLPKKREYTLQRVFDEETGKGKYVVVPLDKEKPFKQESLSKTTMRRMQTESRNFVHGKIAENEKENSAVEGAHKTEQKAEELFGFVKRHYKGKEARQRAKIAKLEKKQFQKEVNFQYQKFLEENPQMQKKHCRSVYRNSASSGST